MWLVDGIFRPVSGLSLFKLNCLHLPINGQWLRTDAKMATGFTVAGAAPDCHRLPVSPHLVWHLKKAATV